MLLGGLLVGCGTRSETEGPQGKPQLAKRPAQPPDVASTQSPSPPRPQRTEPAPEAPVQSPHHTPPEEPAVPAEQPADSAARWIENLPRMKVDDARVAAAGVRKVSSKRLVLYTDLPVSAAIDEIPAMFDQAFPQWCAYFGINAARHDDWRLTGFIIKDKALFRRLGLLPDSLPPFLHGYARNYEFWLYEQPSDYYRSHLALHEGTHALMITILGGCGPTWYMEGIAELLATHLWKDGRLALGHMPARREEVPYWGRIRFVKEAFAQGRPVPLKKIIEYPPHAHLETEPYAWCWAVATLLDQHPKYQQRFRQLHKDVLRADFNQRFYRAFGDDWTELDEHWQLLVADVEYGHDVAATAVELAPGSPLPDADVRVTVRADRGWQNSGIRLQSGATYRLRAAGRYQVADVPQTWWCEPGGVSIRYYRGRPLGILLAAVRPDDPKPGSVSPLLRPKVVGLGTTLVPQQTGTLFLKINDSAAELHDNAGTLVVEIEGE